MKVIIAGSRNIKDYELVKKTIEESGFEITEVVCGEASGVDSLGSRWAKENNIPVKSFPAKWNDLTAPDAIIKNGKYGRYNAKAGIFRNEKMACYSEALVAIWSNNSPGTKNMVQLAEKYNLKKYIKII